MSGAPRPLLQLDGLVKRFGALVATNNLSLSVAEGEIHAVIGPNGAGKTTLISQLLGHLRPDSGTIVFGGRDITGQAAAARSRQGIARSFQLTALCRSLTVIENVTIAVQARSGHSFRFWRATSRDETLLGPARDVLRRIGLETQTDVVAGNLSHGQQRRLDIAMAMATAPRLLLLDEPLAGMGAGEASEMVGLIRSLRGTYTILLVEHDMDAVFSLADNISVLDCGRRIATGTPAEIGKHPEVRRAYLGDRHEG